MGEHIVLCQTGVQQGDPLAPLLFSLGLHEAVEACAEVRDILQQWFLDDGCLRGKFQSLAEALRVLVPALRTVGLEVNEKKCELYSLEQPPAGALPGIPFVADRDSWSYLGVPLAEQSSAAFQGVTRRHSGVLRLCRKAFAAWLMPTQGKHSSFCALRWDVPCGILASEPPVVSSSVRCCWSVRDGAEARAAGHSRLHRRPHLCLGTGTHTCAPGWTRPPQPKNGAKSCPVSGSGESSGNERWN